MGKLIIIIDDSPTIRKIFEVTLHRAGYEVMCFSSAEYAITWLKSAEARIPDLVFVDLLLPKMNGYSAIRFLREHQAFRHIPFVIISRCHGALDKLKGRLVGAVDYLEKPIETATILSAVHRYLDAAGTA